VVLVFFFFLTTYAFQSSLFFQILGDGNYQTQKNGKNYRGRIKLPITWILQLIFILGQFQFEVQLGSSVIIILPKLKQILVKTLRSVSLLIQ
jgi:hypothetical protein